MPGACEFADEAVKDVKCCVYFDSYFWFKLLAWFNLIFMGFLSLALCAAVAAVNYVNDAIEKGEGTITINGEPMAVNDIPEEDLEKLQKGMGAVVFAFILVLYSFVATIAFVCCDSARSRKLYASAIFVGGLASLMAGLAEGKPLGGAVIDILLRVYWAYEMYKLGKLAEDGGQFSKM